MREGKTQLLRQYSSSGDRQRVVVLQRAPQQLMRAEGSNDKGGSLQC